MQRSVLISYLPSNLLILDERKKNTNILTYSNLLIITKENN